MSGPLWPASSASSSSLVVVLRCLVGLPPPFLPDPAVQVVLLRFLPVLLRTLDLTAILPVVCQFVALRIQTKLNASHLHAPGFGTPVHPMTSALRAQLPIQKKTTRLASPVVYDQYRAPSILVCGFQATD